LPFGGAFFEGVITCGLRAVFGFVLTAGGAGLGDSNNGVAAAGVSVLGWNIGASLTTGAGRG
jgi:hypothetical protein